jgi:UDP-N-acetyl-D-galactosamine dehydrogenase
MNDKICIVGLGYVGLPLALEFAKHYDVVGFDIDSERINDLNNSIDQTNECDISLLKQLISNNKINFSSNSKDIANSNIYIVTVPTPIDNYKKPNLKPLVNASKMISNHLEKNDIVIYESTVYPGCTEEVCVPALESFSELKYNVDFFCGYSPERINPGDKVNTLSKIVKVTSGSNYEISIKVDSLYKQIISAGTFLASSIKVAEASKAIENAQRDLNISFVNELSLIFDRIGIDTNEVLEAAGTKWNFLKFSPGLVGGHCIGVDPYYLTYKAESLGYLPEVILSGRRINEDMPNHIVNKLIKELINREIKIKNSKNLLLGITFKENCPDIRNSKVFDVYNSLVQYGINVDVYDPHAEQAQINKVSNIKLIDKFSKYDSIIVAVSHEEFRNLDYTKLKKENKSVIFDVKAFINKNISDIRL